MHHGLRLRAAERTTETPLVEREEVLAHTARAMDLALQGAGSVVVLEAPSGGGKTRLLDEIDRQAEYRGIATTRAACSHLENGFPFGLAIHLLESQWDARPADDRERLARGRGALAVGLLEGRLADVGAVADWEPYPVIRSLLWLVRDLARQTPLVMLIDNAHWADEPSIRFLAYVAARVSDLPVMMFVTALQGERALTTGPFTEFLHSPSSAVLRPAPLTAAGVLELLNDRRPDAGAPQAEKLFAATKGNPFLVVALLTEMARRGWCVDRGEDNLAGVVSDTVVNAVSARLAQMPTSARAFACALAVCGNGTPVKVAARLAELETDEASVAAAWLSDVGLVTSESPLSYVQPVIRAAVLKSMSPLVRGQMHLRAASILREEGLGTERIAHQLMRAPAEGDAEAVQELRATAQRTLRSGNASGAVRLLSRALDEHAPSADVPAVLSELGQAEAQAGLPNASDRLSEAIGLAEEPTRKAELGLAQARLLLSQERYEESAAAADMATKMLERRDPEVEVRLQAAFVSAASFVPALAAEALARRDRLFENSPDVTNDEQRLALAHSLILDGFKGEPRSQIERSVEVARGGDSLVALATPADLSVASLTGALLCVDDLEQALDVCSVVAARSRENDSALARASLGYLSAWPQFEQGRIDEAAANAELAIDAPEHLQRTGRSGYGVLALCRLARGELDLSDRAIANIGREEFGKTISYAFMLEIRAQLRLSQHRPEDALADALEAGRLLESEFGVFSPGAVAWRSTAALAELALGRADRAAALAEQELSTAQRIGVTRIVIRDLRVLGRAVGGSAGLELLQSATAIAGQNSPRLESTLAFLDLGTALRRAKKRAAAREPLRVALELSLRGGATAVARLAKSELSAAGARPRRLMSSGVESLTPAEWRVAELAIRGKTNRQIAEVLFITSKTVEFHLRHIYQKLSIGSRNELAEALRRSDAAA